MEKHYTEFDCDYCRFYPCCRFKDPILGKIIRYHCGDLEEDTEKVEKIKKIEENG